MTDNNSPPATVAVVCMDASHDGRVVRVASFTQQDMGVSDSGAWHQDEVWSRTTGPTGVDAAAVDLFGDQVVPKGSALDDFGGRVRLRYALECKLCGLRVETREAKLWPALDKTAAAGVSVLPLAVLAAMVH